MEMRSGREMFPDEAAVQGAHERANTPRWSVAYLCPMGAWLVSPKTGTRTYVELVAFEDGDGLARGSGVTWEEAARWVLVEGARLEEEGARAVVVYVGENLESYAEGPVARPVYFPDGSSVSGREF